MLTSKQIFDELFYYCQVGYNKISPASAIKINTLAQNILHTFSDPNFLLTRDEAIALLTANHVLANVIAMSSFKTTDSTLEILRTRPKTYPKQMILYTVRNQIQINPREFFDYDAELASLWYDMYLQPAAGRTTELLWENSKWHLSFLDVRYQPTSRSTTNYFLGSYIDPIMSPIVRGQINAGFQRHAPEFINTPKADNIAFIADRWVEGHAVYKTMYSLIEELARKYTVTLVALGPEDNRLDTRLFKNVKRVEYKNKQLDVSQIYENDFQLVYFCDIGMSIESVMLANCRIAPIQVTGNGNPGSTFGAQIDYFITGQSAERLDLLEMNYYEKVILAPGSGSRPERPPCVPTRPQKASEPVIVNVPWGVTKYNYPTLKLLRDVQICSPISIIYHFFPGCGVNRYNCAYPFLRDMDDIFKGQAVYYPNQPYQQHLKNLEDGHFSLDSYPWGGYNSVVDALFLGIPVITWEGNQWYNRVASYLLRRVGLSELVATTEQEYEQLIMKMVTDRAYRDTMASRVQSLDLSVLFEAPEPKYFVTAIDELMERK